MASPPGSPTEAGSKSRDTNLPTTTSPRLDGVFSSSSETDGNNTSSTIDDHSNDLPTTTSSLVNGTNSETSQNDHIESSSTIDDDSINLLATTTPLPSGSSSDTSEDDRSDTSDTIDDDDSIDLLATTTPLPSGISSDTSDTSENDHSDTSDTIDDESENLPTTTSPCLDGSSSDTSNDRLETSSSLGDDSENLPTTTSPRLNGVSSNTSNDRIETSSTLDDDSIQLLATTTPLPDDTSSDSTLTDPDNISSTSSEVHDETVIVSSVKTTAEQRLDLQGLAAAASLLRELDFPEPSSAGTAPTNNIDAAATLPATAWTDQPWSFANLRFVVPSRQPSTQFPLQPRHLANGFHDEHHPATPTTPTPRQGSLGQMRIPQQTTNGDMDGCMPRDNLQAQALRIYENATRLRRAATAADNNNLRDVDVAFPHVNGIVPDTPAPAAASPPGSPRRYHSNGFPVTPARPGSPEASASPQRRLRRVGHSPSLRALSLSAEPILASPDRQRPGTPSPPASEAGMDRDCRAEAYVARLYAAAAEAQGVAVARPEPEPQQVDEVIDDWRAPDDYMSDEEDEDEDDDDREGGAPLNLEEFPEGDMVAARLRAGFEALAAAREEVNALDGGDDGNLPAQGMRGVPAAIRARMELLLVEENFTGATRQLMERLAFEREVAGVARQGLVHWQEEARRLVGFLGEARLDADAGWAQAHSYAHLEVEVRLELARALARLRDAGL
ncbi:hypothetical protein LTS15_006786 [Exophiala xenobiotica]|nr:hypothetical protein LTS15_006786 [Exophiala xenobiotica]